MHQLLRRSNRRLPYRHGCSPGRDAACPAQGACMLCTSLGALQQPPSEAMPLRSVADFGGTERWASIADRTMLAKCQLIASACAVRIMPITAGTHICFCGEAPGWLSMAARASYETDDGESAQIRPWIHRQESALRCEYTQNALLQAHVGTQDSHASQSCAEVTQQLTL